MYNILCLGLCNPSNCQKNADHPFSAIYNSCVQCIIHLVRKRLKDDQNLIQQPYLERPFCSVLAAVIVKEY